MKKEKKEQVFQYFIEHPGSSVSACQAALGCAYHTAQKWYYEFLKEQCLDNNEEFIYAQNLKNNKRTSRKRLVFQYFSDHPEASISDCQTALGCCYQTAQKWYCEYLREHSLSDDDEDISFEDFIDWDNWDECLEISPLEKWKRSSDHSTMIALSLLSAEKLEIIVEQIDSPKSLAAYYAAFSNEARLLAHELGHPYNTPKDNSKILKQYQYWLLLESKLQDRIFLYSRQNGLLSVTPPNYQARVTPFMTQNGYEDCSGWWFQKA